MTKKGILKEILDTKIVAIIRLPSSAPVFNTAMALKEGGIKAIEITMGTPNALGEIEKLAKQEGVLTGVGSVTDPQMVEEAINAGAQYIVTPATQKAVIQKAHNMGKPVLSGALSPTEILQAYQWGADIIKLFPANIFGMPYFKAVKAPMPDIPIMPTGGITIENAAEWLSAGAVALGVGSTLVNKQLIDKNDFKAITQIAIHMRNAVENR